MRPTQVKIPCAILSLFHLLPPAPTKFLDQLVTVTLDLEAALPSTAASGRYWSPFREALLPFINRHAPESVTYFLDRLSDTRYFRLLLSYTKCADAHTVRTELANSAPKLLQLTFDQPIVGSQTPQNVVGGLPPQGVTASKAAELRVQVWSKHGLPPPPPWCRAGV